MHTRMCTKYPITHVNIQEHPTYSNCHTYIHALERKGQKDIPKDKRVLNQIHQ